MKVIVLIWDFKTLFVIGLEYATFCSHLMPHLVSSKCLLLLFAKMKHFEAALTQFYNWTEQCTSTMGLEFISCSIWILKICFWPRAKGQLISEWLFGVLNFPKITTKKFENFCCSPLHTKKVCWIGVKVAALCAQQ